MRIADHSILYQVVEQDTRPAQLRRRLAGRWRWANAAYPNPQRGTSYDLQGPRQGYTCSFHREKLLLPPARARFTSGPCAIGGHVSVKHSLTTLCPLAAESLLWIHQIGLNGERPRWNDVSLCFCTAICGQVGLRKMRSLATPPETLMESYPNRQDQTQMDRRPPFSARRRQFSTTCCVDIITRERG